MEDDCASSIVFLKKVRPMETSSVYVSLMTLLLQILVQLD
jgi:hypothetical protein